jgi:membrane associated rhomboid family serine protease
MPYALRFYLYLFVAGVVVVVLSVWLSPYGLAVNVAFAVIAAYLVVIIGRRVLRRKNL